MLKRILFTTVMFTLLGAVLAAIVLLAYPTIENRLQPRLLNYMAQNLTDKEREEIYDRLATKFGGAWDTVPEPDVARLAKRNDTRIINQVPVRTNNAGLRADVPYVRKARGTYRIICLGDSFVFGSGVLVEDRFCNQLQEFYEDAGITVDGKRIETYGVGLGSWTMVQQCTYLSRRMTEYDPDLIVMMSVANDITDATGITGAGVVTESFSPGARHWGSGAFFNTITRPFKGSGYAAIQWDLSSESALLWDKAMACVARLVHLQGQRGKLILLSTLNPSGVKAHQAGAFTQIFYDRLRRSQIDAPYVGLTYFRNEQAMRLPHDSHPSRLGHAALRDQYVHALQRLGWLKVPQERLPALDARISLELSPEPDLAVLETWKERFLDVSVRESLDFAQLEAADSSAFLGGIFPHRKGKPFADLPWASIRAGFLLRRPSTRHVDGVQVKIKVPPLLELFPLTVEMRLDGGPGQRFTFEEPNDTGVYTLSGALGPPAQLEARVTEVVLRTTSYFAEIRDARMKSYQLVSAKFTPEAK